MIFSEEISIGIPHELPEFRKLDLNIDHAPKRPLNLSLKEKRLAIKNSLRYFPKKWHNILAKEFLEELETYGHIYM